MGLYSLFSKKSQICCTLLYRYLFFRVFSFVQEIWLSSHLIDVQRVEEGRREARGVFEEKIKQAILQYLFITQTIAICSYGLHLYNIHLNEEILRFFFT